MLNSCDGWSVLKFIVQWLSQKPVVMKNIMTRRTSWNSKRATLYKSATVQCCYQCMQMRISTINVCKSIASARHYAIASYTTNTNQIDPNSTFFRASFLRTGPWHQNSEGPQHPPSAAMIAWLATCLQVADMRSEFWNQPAQIMSLSVQCQ